MAKNVSSQTRALLKKHLLEKIYPYRRGRFNPLGFVLGVVLLVGIVVLFTVFFGRFIDVYLAVKTNRQPDVATRTYELLTVVYSVIVLFMTVSAVSQINRQIFEADDVRLFSAMPVDAKALYLSKLIIIYGYQLLISVVAVLAVNITLCVKSPQSWSFALVTAILCFILPLLTIALASLIALPVQLVKRFLKQRFVLNFVFVTVVLGVMFWLYSIVLSAVKQMLLGDELKYFFDERVMTAIASAVQVLYPAAWLVDLLTSRNITVASVGIAATLAVCIALAMVIIRLILQRSLQQRNADTANYLIKRGKMSASSNVFASIVKKDFLLIFRTPSYMFSYLSVAVIMPLMVYFCMTVGTSMVENLVGLQVNVELALFLTLLFGALTNVFCATNVSRDGQMFYTVKAFPLSYKQVFFAKIFLSMAVAVLSQLVSAIVLAATGMVQWYSAIFIFAVGALFGFVNVCVATRYDFNHARFSTEEDGEIKESGNAVSTVIVTGMLASFAVGGIVVALRVLTELKHVASSWITYVVTGALAIGFAVAAHFYLTGKLGKKYYEFEGGEI